MKKVTFKILQIVPLLYFLSACTYQNYEKINPAKVAVNCDTTIVISYVAHIAPLLDKYCNSCHNTKDALNNGGNIILDTYDDASNAGKSLYKQCWGKYAMPKNAAKLDSCDIYALKSWVDKGNLQ
jgi:uncharacterized membrane protein